MNNPTSVPVKEVARIGKLKKKKKKYKAASKKSKSKEAEKAYERPGLLNEILDLKRTDVEGFQKIKSDLGMTHENIARALPIGKGAVSVWLTGKNSDGVPEKWIKRVREIFYIEYCLLNGYPMVPAPEEKEKPSNEGRKSRYSDFLEFIMNDEIPRDAVKAIQENDFQKLAVYYEERLDAIKERASEHQQRIQSSGYNA